MPELLKDPVCGMAIRLGDAVASATMEEQRFHFCCLGCYAAFLDTPHRYVGWAGDPPRSRRGRDGLPAQARSIEATAIGSGRASCHLAS